MKRHALELRTSTRVIVALDSLAESGRFPARRESVAEELLQTALREMELEGWIGTTLTTEAKRGASAAPRKDRAR